MLQLSLKPTRIKNTQRLKLTIFWSYSALRREIEGHATVKLKTDAYKEIREDLRLAV